VGERPHEATSDGTNHTETVWELARVIVSLQWSRQRHYPSRTEVLQPDDDRKAIQLLHGHLVAKSIKGDEAGGRIVEAVLIGFGDAEVWCDDAVFGIEHNSDMAEALRALATEPEGRAGVGRGSGGRFSKRLAIPDLTATGRDHDECPANACDSRWQDIEVTLAFTMARQRNCADRPGPWHARSRRRA
jgi:hypothetical protein